MSEKKQFLAMLERQKEHAETSVRKFVRNQSVEELTYLVAKYVDQSTEEDLSVALEAILAAYGLMVAIRDVAAEDGDEG